MKFLKLYNTCKILNISSIQYIGETYDDNCITDDIFLKLYCENVYLIANDVDKLCKTYKNWRLNCVSI